MSEYADEHSTCDAAIATLRAQLAAAELERDRWRQSERIAVVKLDAAAHRVRALEEAGGILLRACEAGAYTGRSSEAVKPLRALLAPDVRAPGETGG